MIYEPETYIRPPLKEYTIVHIPTGKTYNTMADACRSSGLSPYKMRKMIKDGTIWARPSGIVLAKKRVRCIETRVEYDSISAAARANKVDPQTMSAHLRGRLRSVRGFHFELTGEFTHTVKKVKKDRAKKSPPDMTPVKDDMGREYRGYNHLSREVGMTRTEVIERLRLDPIGVFRVAWVNNAEFYTARYDGKWWWINGSIPVDTFRKFQTVLRLTGKRVTAGEARQLTGDLFR